MILQLVGYLCLVLALAGTATGVWAAIHFSHPRVYARQLARERAMRRNRATG